MSSPPVFRACLVATWFCVPGLFGRTWQTRSGNTVEGEFYRYSKLAGLVLLDAKRNRITIESEDISEADLAFIREHYPEFAGAIRSSSNKPATDRKSAPDKAADIPDDELVSDNPNPITWPKIVIDKDSVAFRWAARTTRFYTRHFRFDANAKLNEPIALDLALRCESAYESVHHCPFWPDGLVRKSADVGSLADKNDQHIKFAVEASTKGGGGGNYNYRNNAQGYITSETITVGCSWGGARRANLSGTLAHEIAHMLTSPAGGSTAIKEGFAEFISFSVYNQGTAEFKRFDALVPQWREELRLGDREVIYSASSLEDFLTMTQYKFYGAKKDNNYRLAHLLFVYFADNEPETFRKFLRDALFDDNLMHPEPERIARTAKAIPTLLNKRKAKEVEALICGYFKGYGITLKF